MAEKGGNMLDIGSFASVEVKDGKPYVVVTVKADESDETAYRIISRSRPKFIPVVTASETSGERKFNYDVTREGFQQVGSLTGGMSPIDFLTLMKNLTEAIVQSVDCFLNPLNFLVVDDYIYVNSENFDVRVIYVPLRNALLTEEGLNRWVYDLARSLSRKLSGKPPSNEWQEIISHLWDMPENLTVYETKDYYDALYNDRRNITALRNNVGTQNKSAKPKIEITPPSQSPSNSAKFEIIREEPKNKGFGFFAKLFGTKTEKKQAPIVNDNTVTMVSFENIMTEVDLSAESGIYPKAVLHVVENGEKTVQIPISKSSFVLGRNLHEVDYCFNSERDVSISRKHVEINCEAGKYYITQISATAGVYTYINQDKQVAYDERVLLENGDTIRIGKRELLFEMM